MECKLQAYTQLHRYYRFTLKPFRLSCILPIQMAGDILVLTALLLSPFSVDHKSLSCFSDSLLLKGRHKYTYVYTKVLKQVFWERKRKGSEVAAL